MRPPQCRKGWPLVWPCSHPCDGFLAPRNVAGYAVPERLCHSTAPAFWGRGTDALQWAPPLRQILQRSQLLAPYSRTLVYLGLDQCVALKMLRVPPGLLARKSSVSSPQDAAMLLKFAVSPLQIRALGSIAARHAKAELLTSQLRGVVKTFRDARLPRACTHEAPLRR